MTVFDAVIYANTSVFMWKSIVFWFCTVWCLHTRCEMRQFYTLRCPAPFWLIQCKPYRNRFIIAKVIDKSLGARFYGPLCIVAKPCVLEQVIAYRKSYEKLIGNWYQNEWPWRPLFRGRVNSMANVTQWLSALTVSIGTQPLRHIRHWISRKPLEIEAWFQRTTNRKWHMGYQMVTWPMTVKEFRQV